jgi:hypothetical protein
MFTDLSKVELEFSPGTGYRYSNFGVGLLGIVVGRVAGVRYRDFVNREILAPLGMRSTFWAEGDVPKERLATAYAPGPNGPKKVPLWRLGYSEAAGGLYSSLRDLARYASFQLAAYPPRSEAESGPLRRSSVREAHAIQRYRRLAVSLRDDAKENEPLVEATASGIGLAWHAYETCDFEQVVWHNGGTDGFSASIHMLPQRGVAIMLLANYVDTDQEPIVVKALDILRESGGLSPRAFPVTEGFAKAASKLVDLHTTFSERAYEDLFEQTFRDAVSASDMATSSAHLQKLHGTCKGISSLRMKSASSGTFSVACDRGRLEFAVTLAPTGKVAGASVESMDLPPSDAVARAAGRITGLIDSWDDAAYRSLLASTFSKAETKSLFRDIGATHKGCTVEKPVGGDGEARASLALSCKRGGPLKLDLALDDKGERATLLKIVPMPSARAGGKCPLR